MADCPKASEHTQYAHVDLGDDAYRHLKRKLTHSEAQQVEVAQLAANYETAGTRKLTMALIQATLTAEDGDWRKEHYDNTLALVDHFLEQYETDHELALMQPKARQAMAEASYHVLDVFGRVFTLEGDVWPPENGQHARIIQRKAQTLWNAWYREMNDRLKAAGADSD